LNKEGLLFHCPTDIENNKPSEQPALGEWLGSLCGILYYLEEQQQAHLIS
jgi:hypothetical protein